MTVLAVLVSVLDMKGTMVKLAITRDIVLYAYMKLSLLTSS